MNDYEQNLKDQIEYQNKQVSARESGHVLTIRSEITAAGVILYVHADTEPMLIRFEGDDVSYFVTGNAVVSYPGDEQPGMISIEELAAQGVTEVSSEPDDQGRRLVLHIGPHKEPDA